MAFYVSTCIDGGCLSVLFYLVVVSSFAFGGLYLAPMVVAPMISPDSPCRTSLLVWPVFMSAGFLLLRKTGMLAPKKRNNAGQGQAQLYFVGAFMPVKISRNTVVD